MGIVTLSSCPLGSTTVDGLTPLHQAAAQGLLESVKALLDAGADLNRKDSNGHTPLEMAKMWCHPQVARWVALPHAHLEQFFGVWFMVVCRSFHTFFRHNMIVFIFVISTYFRGYSEFDTFKLRGTPQNRHSTI